MRKQVFWVLFLATSFLKAEDQQKMVEKEIERINSLRETLVSGVQGDVDAKTFKAVCMPVGKELKAFAKKNGFKLKQAAVKYRNPKHIPNEVEQAALEKMQKDKDLIQYWQNVEKASYYFRRIDVQAACLNCHGPKDSRPLFIKKKYPKDKAYDFAVGDLRAIYSVYVPKN